MTKKKTQKQLVAERLIEGGAVSNFWAIENKLTIRLGAIIHELRKEGWVLSGGFLPGTRNWEYRLDKSPLPPKRQMYVKNPLTGKLITVEEYQKL